MTPRSGWGVKGGQKTEIKTLGGWRCKSVGESQGPGRRGYPEGHGPVGVCPRTWVRQVGVGVARGVSAPPQRGRRDPQEVRRRQPLAQEGVVTHGQTHQSLWCRSVDRSSLPSPSVCTVPGGEGGVPEGDGSGWGQGRFHRWDVNSLLCFPNEEQGRNPKSARVTSSLTREEGPLVSPSPVTSGGEPDPGNRVGTRTGGRGDEKDIWQGSTDGGLGDGRGGVPNFTLVDPDT